MESQTHVSKRAPRREFRNWRVQGNPPSLSANPLPTLRQPFANPLPTFAANLFCEPLSNPLFPWTPGTRLETRVNGFCRLAPTSQRKILTEKSSDPGIKRVVSGLFATGPPGPRPRIRLALPSQGSILHRFNIDLTSK